MENRGAMIEAFAGQELLAYQDPADDSPLYYWHREARSSNAEVDYVIQKENTIIPVEVKSGTTGRLRSMHEFLAEHSASKYGLRFYDGAYHTDGLLKSYPLYAIASAVGIRQDAIDYITG